MTLKLVALICLLGAAVAFDYEYQKPKVNFKSSSKANGNVNSIGFVQRQSNISSRAAKFGNSQSTSSRNDVRSRSVVASTFEAEYPPAKYEFKYAVNDEANGDIKSHSETRDGDHVSGSYSVVDPDGYKRIVTYTVDGDSGFNAIVTREPYVLKTISKVVAAPVVKIKAVESTSTIDQQPQQFQTKPQVIQSLQSQSQSQNVQPQQFQSQSQALQSVQSPSKILQGLQPKPQQFQSQPLQPQQQAPLKETRLDLPIQPRDSYASRPAKRVEGPYS